MKTGGCLCGAVRYEIHGVLRDVVNCHRTMCQTDIHLTRDEGLTWYITSEVARRGFCGKCGSNLFWEPFDQSTTGIVGGTLDVPTGLKTMGHIFVAEMSDFYRIEDNLPQFSGSSEGQLPGDFK
ncbi:MAG: GFA family protein [Gammaproteobacteria bacterium]